jgi:hypothetical protein
MKHSTVLATSLLMLLLGSPLLGLEGVALPDAEGASKGVTPSLVNEVVQATPVACESFILPLPIDTGMKAKECLEVYGCCVCAQRFPGEPCLDWEGC